MHVCFTFEYLKVNMRPSWDLLEANMIIPDSPPAQTSRSRLHSSDFIHSLLCAVFGCKLVYI